MSGKKKLVDEVVSLARKELGSPEARTIKGAELLKKTEGLTEDPFGFSKFSKPLSEMEYTVKMLPREEYKTVDPYDLVKQKATIAGHISDRTAAGRKVTNIGGVDLTEPLTQRGGVDFQRTTPYAWANRPGAGKGLNKKLNEAAKSGDPVYTTPVFMGASSANSSHMVGVPLIRMIPNLPISKSDKLAFDAMMSERFPGWPGIDNTEEAEKFMYSGKVPGSAISRFIDYASAKKWRGAGFPDTSEIMFSAMDPRLVGVNQGSAGMGFKQFDPGKEVIIKGENAHPDYPAAIPGKEYAGGFKYQTPQSVMFPDWWKSLKPELRDPKNATKAQHTLMTQVPTQKATPEWADKVLHYWEKNPVKWGYASGGEVDDDVNDALRIAKDVGGGTEPQVFMTDAQGRQYDATGKPIQPVQTQDKSNSAAQVTPAPEQAMGVAPQNYETEVKPLIDYAMTPIDRPGMPSEPDLVQAMKVATQVAAQGQPQETRGEGNLARRREEAVRGAFGADKEGYASEYKGPFSYNPGEMAGYANTLIDFSPWALGEVAHDIPYEAGRTGDYQTAAVEGGINAALTAPVIGAAGRGAKKGYEFVARHPALAAGAAGMIGMTADPAEAEAGPARWFSKALEVAQAIPMEKMTGEQALAMLKRSVSPEELRWTGTDKFLSSTPKLSKGELIDHLNKNRLQLNQITLGGKNPSKLMDVSLFDVDNDIREKFAPTITDLDNQMRAADAQMKSILSADGQIPYDKYAEYKSLSGKKQQAYDTILSLNDAMKQEHIDRRGGLSKPTKYGPDSVYSGLYTPGGSGYRENLYQLPQQDIYTPYVNQMHKDYWQDAYNDAINEGFDPERAKKFADRFLDNSSNAQMAKALGREDEFTQIFNKQKELEKNSYKGGHWGENPDVLFHTRTQELIYDPPGANRPYRVHNVDENQSDLGQAGRKTGFYNPEEASKWEADMISARKARDDAMDVLGKELERFDEKFLADYGPEPRGMNPAWNHWHAARQDAMDADEGIRAARDAIETAANRYEEFDINRAPVRGKFPRKPFVTSTEGWTDRAIKHELDKALDNGSDYFSWTPGQVHADRYDLSRHIGRVRYDPYYGWLTAHDPNGRHIIREELSDPSKLDEYIGKELGDNIRAMADQRKAEFYGGISIDKNPNTGGWDIMRDGKPVVLYGQDATGFPRKSDAAEFVDGAFGDSLKADPIQIEGLDLKTGGEGMIGYYDKVYLKRVQDVLKKATGQKPEIEVIEVQTADGPRKQLGVRLTDEMREKARFSDFNRGGTVTGSHSYGNDGDVVNTALALTREY